MKGTLVGRLTSAKEILEMIRIRTGPPVSDMARDAGVHVEEALTLLVDEKRGEGARGAVHRFGETLERLAGEEKARGEPK